MDPYRYRRVGRWLRNLRWASSSGLLHRLAWWGTLCFTGLAVAAWILVQGLGDRWWPATVLLFGPRWVLLLPLIPLLPLAALRDRALLPPLLLGGLIIAGPVMGLETGWRSLLPSGEDSQVLKVVTFNARGGNGLTRSPANLLMDWGADIVGVQECGGEFHASLRGMPGWHVDTRKGLCLASRFEIVDVAEMDREALEFAGGAGLVVTYELDLGERHMVFTILHLETPRAGFELLRAGRVVEGIPKIREKSFLRGVELRQARLWANAFPGPHLVVGDFNTPPESRSYRESWDGWQNAFSVAGRGLGGSRLNGWIRVRIDHILADDNWRVLDAWVEKDVGSDHLPVAARLRLR